MDDVMRRCSNYHCRTSLDEHPVECPHRLPFCGACVWEDGCDECVLEPMRQRGLDAWNSAAEPQPWTPERDQWTDYAAEHRADMRAVELAHLEDREERAS